jgi:hypothetical protein
MILLFAYRKIVGDGGRDRVEPGTA